MAVKLKLDRGPEGGALTCALLKVNIMPPPIRMVSHLVSIDSSTGSLVDTCTAHPR